MKKNNLFKHVITLALLLLLTANIAPVGNNTVVADNNNAVSTYGGLDDLYERV